MRCWVCWHWDAPCALTRLLLTWDGDLHLCGIQWLLLDSLHLSATWGVWNSVSMRISKFLSKCNNPAESVSAMWINSCDMVLGLCIMWIFHQIHDYKEGTPEEKTYYIELWDVGGSVGSATSVKSTRAVFYNLLNGKFAWCKYGFNTVYVRSHPLVLGQSSRQPVWGLYCPPFWFMQEQTWYIHRQKFMDSVVNSIYFRQTCAD